MRRAYARSVRRRRRGWGSREGSGREPRAGACTSAWGARLPCVQQVGCSRTGSRMRRPSLKNHHRRSTFLQRTKTSPTDYVPVKRHRGEPGHTRDTHGTRGRAHGHTEHTVTDKPHNHPNPTTHPHDHATAETVAGSTSAGQARNGTGIRTASTRTSQVGAGKALERP